jgi:ubiquitin C-terminal hydrolase
VVLHFGNLENGHYIAYGKRNEEWFEFNDEKVSPIKVDEVQGDKDAYLLMY